MKVPKSLLPTLEASFFASGPANGEAREGGGDEHERGRLWHGRDRHEAAARAATSGRHKALIVLPGTTVTAGFR